jgi:hypothetical protein
MILQNGKPQVLILHVAAWAIFLLAPLLLSPPGDFEKALVPLNLLSLLLRNGILIGLFYLNLYYLTPVVLQKKGLLLYIVFIVVAVVVVSIANWKIHNTLSEPAGPPPPWSEPFHNQRPMHNPRPLMFASPLFSSFLITSLIIIFSTSLFLWDDWTKAKELAREQEIQRKSAELSALKLQISPHFLFNTLNNIRWLVRSKSDQAEDSVVKLSQLLRYMLYQTSTEKVGLIKEIEHLKGYIDLQSMRLTIKESFSFQVSGDATNKMIVPLLLLPIAENLFKHGKFNQDSKNSVLLRIENGLLTIDAKNKIARSTDNAEKDYSGIGLANLKKRLAMHYPNNHFLEVHEENDIYFLHLEILLN